MSEFSTWYKSVPQFTRYWLTATVGVSVLAKIGIIPPALLYLDSTLVFQKFQVSDGVVLSSVHQLLTLLVSVMETSDLRFLLSNWISFPHELLFPIQLFVAIGERSFLGITR
jgi:hypothetical protein